MNSKLVLIIKEKFEEKSNEDLINIYKKNERYNYSEEAFEAIKIILGERNLEIPDQELPVYEKKKNEIIKFSDRYYKLKRNGYVGMVSGLVLIVLSSVIDGIMTSNNRMGMSNLLYFPGVYCWFWGFHKYVLRKGYGSAYTLLGIFGLIGLLIMHSKADLGEAKNENE